MQARYDIAILGGGVIGLALARALALAPKTPALAVIDASSRIPPATLAAAGMLTPSFEDALGGDALYDLGAASLDMWPAFAASLVEETGADIDFRGDGVFGVAVDAAGAQKLDAQYEALTGRGVDVALMTGAEARALEPALSDRIAAALHAPRDAQVDPVKLFAALRLSLERRGASLIDDHVAAAERQSDGWRVTLGEGGGVVADQIVVATGAASGWVIDGVPRPPVFPVKGEAFSIAAPPAPASVTRVIRGPGAYVCPKAGGRIVIGATEQEGRDDLAVSAAGIESLRNGAAEIVPALQNCAEIARWAGLRPATPDGAPILGVALRGARGAWLALGHHRNGVLLAPASAAALATEILGEKPAIDLAPFRPDRFG